MSETNDTQAPLREALKALGRLPPTRRFPSDGLVLKLVPREAGLQQKDVPVDALFHKVTMMRDKLRVLEQRVNASEAVSEDEKIALQARITEVYLGFAALTAFFTDEALPQPPREDGA